MVSKYFYVHNGLTVGDLTIDADSGNFNTTGTITASNITISGDAVLTTASISTNAVSTLIAGTDTAASASIGAVTVWNTSTLQSVTDRGATTNQAVNITNATQSSSTITGALVVTGGTGVGGNLYVGGTIYSSGTAVQSQLVSGNNIKTVNGTSLLGSGDYSVLPTVAAVTGDIIGVVNRSQATLSFNDSTRTFTVTPTTSSWDLYYIGTPYAITTSTSTVITNTDGARWIKIDPTTLQLVEFFGAPAFESNINLAYIYWSTNTSHALIVGDERHGSKRDTTWHSVTHANVGTVWRSGGALSYTLNSSTNVTLSVGTPLIIQDEDLTHTITHSATPNGFYEQVLDSAAELEVLYLNGTTYSYTTATSSPWIAGTSLAAYNYNNGTSWTLADASEGDYITYWLLATNDIRSPVKLVLGRLTHASLNDAYSEEFVEYGLSFAEQVFIYQIVVQTSSAFTGNAAKVQIAGVRKILSKSATSAAATVAATNHNDLTGREADDAHSIGSITNLQSSLDAKQATLVSGTNIKTVNGNSLVGSGNLELTSTTASTFTFNSTVTSSSTTTGAVVILGGLGVQGNVNVGGSITVSTSSFINGSAILTAGDLETITTTATYITNDPTSQAGLATLANTTTVYGTYNFGDINAISTFGDYNTATNVGFYSINDASGVPGYIVYIGFTGITEFNRLVANINYTQNSGHTVYVDLYNYTLAQWDTFTTYSGLAGWFQFALGVISPTEYISGGKVTARLYHVSTGNTAHRTWIDYVALEQSITGGQGPRGATGATGATGPQGLTTSTTATTFNFFSTANSTSTATGAVVVAGGVGIAGDVYLGGTLYGTVTTATSLASTGTTYVGRAVLADSATTATSAATAYALASTGTTYVGRAVLADTATTATSAATAYSTIGTHTAGTGLTGTAFNGSANQTWTLNTATLIATAVTATSAATAYALASTGTTYVGNAVTATNISGGAANRIPYNTAAGITTFVTAPTTASTYLSWSGSAFQWNTVAATGGGWTRKTANYTAVSGDKIIADSSSGTFTITLPATPAAGDYVQITDGASWSITGVTVARNGSTIEGGVDDVILNAKGISVEFVFDGTTWQVTATLGAKGADGPPGTAIRTINYVIDGGGFVITTGSKGYIHLDYPATINSWTVLTDTTSSTVIDISKASYTNFPTFTASGGTSPTVTSAVKGAGSVNWTNFTTIAASEVLQFSVNSNTTATRIAISLKVTTLI